MSAFWVLAYNGFREARRNRVTIVVAAFAIAILASSVLAADVAVATFDRVLIDLGLGSMSILLTFLAIFLSSGLLSREIERRTIFLVVARPISRSQFLLAKCAGNMLTLTALAAAMTLVFCGAMWAFGAPMRSEQFLAIALGLIELLILTSFGLLMSSFASQLVSAVVTAGIYFAGHLAADIYQFSERSKMAVLRVLGKATYYLLPNLERLNLRPKAAYQIDVSFHEVVPAAVYGVSYAAIVLALAVIVFQRRDFK